MLAWYCRSASSGPAMYRFWADCASCCASRVDTALVVEARESGLWGPCCERVVCVRCLAAMLFMLAVVNEKKPGAWASWADCERLCQLGLSLPGSLVTGTALADQMSYLSKTMGLRVSMVQDVAGEWEQDGSQVAAASRVCMGGGRMVVSGRPGI